MIGWNFPPNNNGQEQGLNDSGIETFKGSPWQSLAREIIQNSCDAVHNKEQPVEVHFDLYHIDLDMFPGKNEFIDILGACKVYSKDNVKAQTFFKKAINVFKNKKIPVLKISDYNTTGLTESDKNRGGNWNNLIKSTGVSNKDPSAGGSFGIGKHAPFVCSNLRTIFYGTKDIDDKTAFQGVSKLITHFNENNETTQGTGYFGYKEKNLSLKSFKNINSFFDRTNVGTDVYIVGFKEEKDWDIKIIESVLENFFYAIFNNKLVVKVDGEYINKEALPEMLDTFTKQNPDFYAYKYYLALTSNQSHRFLGENFKGLGTLDLYVLTGKDFPKKVAMIRDTGMKIFNKGQFRTPMKFIAVMIAHGEKLNKILKELEPPSHDDWQHERYEDDTKFAKKLKRDLYSWINQKIRDVSRQDQEEAYDAPGISQFLPDDNDELPIEDDRDAEGERTEPLKVEIQKNESQRSIQHTQNSPGDINKEIGGNDEESSISGEPENNGNANPKDNKSPKQGGGDGDEHKERKQGSKDNTPFQKRNQSIELKNLKLFCVDSNEGLYKIILTPVQDTENGYLKINISGEEDTDAAPIESSYYYETNRPITVKRIGNIGPIKLQADKKNQFMLKLQEPLRYALEVFAYESE